MFFQGQEGQEDSREGQYHNRIEAAAYIFPLMSLWHVLNRFSSEPRGIRDKKLRIRDSNINIKSSILFLHGPP
jgi:hypothetical protein